MRFITGWALERRSVTVLALILILAAGVFTYRALPVELFPEIEFPLVTVTTFYPSANPEAVAQDVTAPIENAMSGTAGLDNIQSTSSENRSIILATFEFGTDMEEAENTIRASVGAIAFPDGVIKPNVGRISSQAFPIMQISVTGDRPAVEIQQIVESRILPEITGVDGVLAVNVTGGVQQQATVTVDTDKLNEKGLSLFQVSQALRENNITLPGGAITDAGRTLPVKTTHTYTSIEEIRNLTVGFSGMPMAGMPPSAPSSGSPPPAPVPITLEEIADVELGASAPTSISRTNGRPGIGIALFKDPEANTIDITTAIEDALDSITGMPPDIETIIVSNDGPAIQGQIDTLQQEAILGLTLAVMVVFTFFVTIKPTVIRGMLSTLRPTIVIGLSIPLSIFTGVLLMNWQGLSLNFMTLGGLAISVGRVVDDSIVVLENIYRSISGGKERWRAALDATVEVGPAITASTLTTIVVFLPLAFIQGLVGAFFLPFALTVCFALIASLAVALTAIPVLAAYLIKQGDLPEGVGEDEDVPDTNTWLQRVYTPILRWSLAHKAITLVSALVITVASLGLMSIIPVNLFPAGEDRFLNIEMKLSPGTPAMSTLAEVGEIESRISPESIVYVTTIGSPSAEFGAAGPSGFHQATTFVSLDKDAPTDIANMLRDEFDSTEDRIVNVSEIGQGPPEAGLEISITGANYADISSIATQLTEKLETIEGIENISSDVSEARDEVIVNVDPARAALVGLNAQQIAFQVNQFLVGQKVTQLQIDGGSVDVFLNGSSADITSVDEIGAMTIAGPLGTTALSDVATVEVRPGPVSISRTDGLRSASIGGSITSDDTQAIGIEIQAQIDSLDLPPGVTVNNGGVFQQIAEGFQDVFIAMAVGIVLVYLVMVATLGSLRNPFVIVTSMPLALIGVMVSLAITGRSLSLAAMMGVLLLIGIVVTNAIVLISFVEQLREKGMNVYDAMIQGGRVRLRPILMTAITTSIALLPLAAFTGEAGGIIGAELATVVIGGLLSSTALTLIVVPVVYMLMNQSIPALLNRLRWGQSAPAGRPDPAAAD